MRSWSVSTWCAVLMCTVVLTDLRAGEDARLIPGVSRIHYRDWCDSYRIANKQAHIVIVPRVGARLAEISLNGRNMLFEDYTVNGFDIEIGGVKTGNVEWAPWDGCQPDLFNPSRGHQCDQLWISPYTLVEQGPYTLTFQSAVSAKHKAQVIKRFTLDQEAPRLAFEYSVTNTDKTARKWACYYRIMCKTPSFVLFPAKPGGKYRQGYLFNPRSDKRDKKVQEECVQVRNGVVAIAPHDLLSDTSGQVSSDTDAGWIAVVRNNLVLIVQYDAYPDKEYVGGHTVSVWWEAERAVLEPRGPYVPLKPGQSAACNTTWTLVRLKQHVASFEQAFGVLSTIQEHVSKQ